MISSFRSKALGLVISNGYGTGESSPLPVLCF
jgi:hypothetical protein